MENNWALFMWRRRLSSRLKIIREGLALICDFWTTLYIIAPALIILGYGYVKLLVALPGWFDPGWEVLLIALLAYFMVRGNLRTYISEADLTYLLNEKAFPGLTRLGLLSSMLLNCLGVLLLLIGLYPFYLHLEAVNLISWLAVGGWVLSVRSASLLIVFYLRGKRTKTAYKMIFMALFIMMWNQLVLPFVSSSGAVYATALIGSVVFMILVSLFLMHFLPVKDWEKMVQEETANSTRMLGNLLGYAGRIPGRRYGCSIWSTKRLGIRFVRQYTLTYFFSKYFLRNKDVHKLFLQIFAFSILVIYTLPYMESVLFLAASNFMWALLVKSIVNDNAGKLKHYTTGLNYKDRAAGLGVLYLIIMTPICLLPLITIGSIGGIQVLCAIIILFLASLLSARFLGNKGV